MFSPGVVGTGSYQVALCYVSGGGEQGSIGNSKHGVYYGLERLLCRVFGHEPHSFGPVDVLTNVGNQEKAFQKHARSFQYLGPLGNGVQNCDWSSHCCRDGGIMGQLLEDLLGSTQIMQCLRLLWADLGGTGGIVLPQLQRCNQSRTAPGTVPHPPTSCLRPCP